MCRCRNLKSEMLVMSLAANLEGVVNARYRRIPASLSSLCLDQPWLGQSPGACPGVACIHVPAARTKGVGAVADLASDNVDDHLGVAWVCLCALRHVAA